MKKKISVLRILLLIAKKKMIAVHWKEEGSPSLV